MAMDILKLNISKAVKSEGPWKRVWNRLIHKKLAMISLVLIIVVYMAGIFAPWIAPSNYSDQNLLEAKQGPSLEHLAGTDRLGRDMLSRVLYGIQTTVIITITSMLTGGLLIGLSLGLISGYFGGKVDSIIMRLGEVFAAFPGILLMILLAATVKPRVLSFARSVEDLTGIDWIIKTGIVDYIVVFGALAAFSWVGMARLVRGQVLSLKTMQFIDAARAAGASTPRILFFHLLPNAISPVVVSITMGMGSIVGAEIVLSWLGIGIQPPRPSLGNMIFENGSLGVLRSDPHLLLVPIAIAWLLIFTWNLLGDGLNDVLNPRTR
jgi:ABC-type dipeptide/oligopeptide/nickel transport system permease subunit